MNVGDEGPEPAVLPIRAVPGFIAVEDRLVGQRLLELGNPQNGFPQAPTGRCCFSSEGDISISR
jgi:hypothetical protein